MVDPSVELTPAGHRAVEQRQTPMARGSVKLRIPCAPPSSRPVPDIFNPPYGASKSKSIALLTVSEPERGRHPTAGDEQLVLGVHGHEAASLVVCVITRWSSAAG